MTPAERITAAIGRLEQLKADSTSGPWDTADSRYGLADSLVSTSFAEVAECDMSSVTDTEASANADLIVTLHRTIDAQLAILGSGLVNQEYDDQIIAVYALALADAILGES